MFRKFKSMKEKLEAAKELEEKSKQLALRYGAPRSIFYIAGTAVLGLAGIYFAASNWSLDKEIEKRIPKTEFVSAESYDSLKEKVNALSVEAKVREEESKELSAKAEEKRKDFEKKQKEAEEARANIEAQIKSIEESKKAAEIPAPEPAKPIEAVVIGQPKPAEPYTPNQIEAPKAKAVQTQTPNQNPATQDISNQQPAVQENTGNKYAVNPEEMPTEALRQAAKTSNEIDDILGLSNPNNPQPEVTAKNPKTADAPSVKSDYYIWTPQGYVPAPETKKPEDKDKKLYIWTPNGYVHVAEKEPANSEDLGKTLENLAKSTEGIIKSEQEIEAELERLIKENRDNPKKLEELKKLKQEYLKSKSDFRRDFPEYLDNEGSPAEKEFKWAHKEGYFGMTFSEDRRYAGSIMCGFEAGLIGKRQDGGGLIGVGTMVSKSGIGHFTGYHLNFGMFTKNEEGGDFGLVCQIGKGKGQNEDGSLKEEFNYFNPGIVFPYFDEKELQGYFSIMYMEKMGRALVSFGIIF